MVSRHPPNHPPTALFLPILQCRPRGCAKDWEQCGGTGPDGVWMGPTCCPSGATCVKKTEVCDDFTFTDCKHCTGVFAPRFERTLLYLCSCFSMLHELVVLRSTRYQALNNSSWCALIGRTRLYHYTGMVTLSLIRSRGRKWLLDGIVPLWLSGSFASCSRCFVVRYLTCSALGSACWPVLIMHEA